MRTCPACEEPLEDARVSACTSCGARLEGSTEAFTAVSEESAADEPVSEETGTVEGPVLVVHKGPEVGQRFVIDRQRLSVGRDPECDIFLNDVTVSRDHAFLTHGGDEVTIEDSGSLNGTYVNGIRVDRALLNDGDIVQVGTFQMLFMGGHRT